MVSSITTGTASVSTLGLDPSFVRKARGDASAGGAGSGDAVQLGDAASWQAARSSVDAGLDQLQRALSAGASAGDVLNQIQALASDPNATQADLDALLAQYSSGVDAAVAGGARLVGGDNVSVQAEPGASPITIEGLDLSLKSDPSSGDAISISADSQLGPGLANAARASLTALNAGMTRFADAARALEAHQGFLGAAEDASGGAKDDLDADSARLLALQVSQGLSAAGGAIANVEPQAVLALFRV